MCGIAGIFQHNSIRSGDAERALISAREKLSHRGPDDRGYEFIRTDHGPLHLAHTRLSILDLSSLGHQPMSTPDRRFVTSFNGEIYNYKELREELKDAGYHFSTQTDTEVLLQAWSHWGEESVKKLNGMFAFVIYDRKKSLLWAVRDAFGIKPFYYRSERGQFIFASEIPSLLQMLPKAPSYNIKKCYDYLMFGIYDQGDETFYEGIQQLPAGHLLKLNVEDAECRPTLKRWWNPSLKENGNVTFEEAKQEVKEMFLDNIRLHLRSDVPLGAALSGGIDSSAVVCSMRKLYPDMPIHTFSYIPRGSDYNEEKWIDCVNKHVGAIPHKIEFTSDELLDDLDDLIQAQGEPFSSTSIYAQYRVFKKVRESDITVTLDGQGADELMAGYYGYPISRMKSLIETREFGQLYRFANSWRRRHGRSKREMASYVRSAMVSDSMRDIADRIGRKPDVDWLNYPYLHEQNIVLNHRPPQMFTNGKGRRLTEALYNALTKESLGALLRHGDRNSMRWSVESRVPFLTTNFAEYLLQLPENYLLSDSGQTKHIFREAMRGIVPDRVLDRQDKIGFQTPERDILKEIGNQVIDSIDSLDVLPFVNVDKLRDQLSITLHGGSKHGGSKQGGSKNGGLKKGGSKNPLRVWHIYNMSRFISMGTKNANPVGIQ